MRLRKDDFSRRVNGCLRVEFGDERITSYAGLELFIRHLRNLCFNGQIRHAFATVSLGGDYGPVAMVRTFLALLWVGGRRLRHVRFVSRDPLVQRFCGLKGLPDERTLSRWLRRFTKAKLTALATLSREVVFGSLDRLRIRALTIDVDGTVLSTGLHVERAQRGYNPHHRKVPSYFPIIVHIAETGQIFTVENRSGNVHDGKAGVKAIRQSIQQLRDRLGDGVCLRFRMDAAFFRRDVLATLDHQGVDYAIKVPMHQWLGLKPKIQMRVRWADIGNGVSGFVTELPIKQWGKTLRVICYRKKVFHETAKNFQLDLFDPDDGTYEYSAIATSLHLSVKDLWLFMAGRGNQEKTIAELKDGLAFDSIPTKYYGANGAWQWLVVLAHNLHRDFQIARARTRSRRPKKKTCVLRFDLIRTTRFQWLNLAGRLIHPAAGLTLRLQANPEVEKWYDPWLKAS